MSLYFTTLSKPFDEHELKVRVRAGSRIIELQNALLHARETLREQATRDSRTRVWNRSSILDILQRELSRSQRERCPMGVLLVDLDHFKRVNDTYGHATGDAVLAEATRRMQANTLEYDSIGRYGGEEFLVILPGCDDRTTFTQALRMCTALASRRIITRDQQLRVTASFGATSISPGMLFVPERIIRQVDAALYRAKEHGRNRVEYIAIDERAAKHNTDECTLTGKASPFL